MPENSKYLVEIEDAHLSFNHHTVLEGVTCRVAPGQITAIMGPSGTGKTTLLKLITGQLTPDSGDCRVMGLSVPSLSNRRLFRLRQRMGVLFQSGALFTDLDVFDNVAFPLREHTSLPPRLIRYVVLMKLEAVGLRGAAHLMPSELSGGMKLRVALARAVAMDPMMVLYDEPFSGLDPISVGRVIRLVRLLNRSLALTSIIVSHDVNVVEQVADYAYIIADGRVIGHGPPSRLLNDDSAWIRQFMHGQADGPVPFHYPAEDYASVLMHE